MRALRSPSVAATRLGIPHVVSSEQAHPATGVWQRPGYASQSALPNKVLSLSRDRLRHLRRDRRRSVDEVAWRRWTPAASALTGFCASQPPSCVRARGVSDDCRTVCAQCGPAGGNTCHSGRDVLWRPGIYLARLRIEWLCPLLRMECRRPPVPPCTRLPWAMQLSRARRRGSDQARRPRRQLPSQARCPWLLSR